MGASGPYGPPDGSTPPLSATFTARAARPARKNGAQVIALTNNPGSRLAHDAEALLCATAEESPLIGEHGAARVSQARRLLF